MVTSSTPEPGQPYPQRDGTQRLRPRPFDFRHPRFGTQWLAAQHAPEGAGMADSDGTTHQVVINDEEQYSVWPLGRELPAGWRAAGTTGPKDACLAWIDDNWTDMRPRSLRVALG